MTSSELLTQLIKILKNPNADATEQARLLKRLDRAHKSVIAGGMELNRSLLTNKTYKIGKLFSWAKATRPLTFVLEPKQTGTITVSQEATSATISIDSTTKDLTGWFVQLSPQEDFYEILTHSGTGITLDAGWVQDSATASACTFAKLNYTAGSDVLVIADHARIKGNESGISLVGEPELEKRYPLQHASEGAPELIGISKIANGVAEFRVSHYPRELTRVSIPYTAIPSELSTTTGAEVDPIIEPRHAAECICFLAAFYEMRDDNNEDALSYLRSAQYLFDGIVGFNNTTNLRGDNQSAAVPAFPGGFGNRRKRYN